jgi:DNA-directed RNA polymerase subunit RPC12/RpoP
MELILIFWLLCAGIGMAIASAKNRSLMEGFFLSLLCGIFGVIIEALLPKEQPKGPPAPPGLTAVVCPRCNAAQNVPNPMNYECWQCHLRVAYPVPQVPPVPTLASKQQTIACPGCSTFLVVADPAKPKFKCSKCGGTWPTPIPRDT